MNLTTEKKPLTLLFNPFFYVAGGKALGIGLAAILLAGLVGALGNTHFDGVLDTHTGAHAPLWFFLAEGIIDWLCLGAVLLVFGPGCVEDSVPGARRFGNAGPGAMAVSAAGAAHAARRGWKIWRSTGRADQPSGGQPRDQYPGRHRLLRCRAGNNPNHLLDGLFDVQGVQRFLQCERRQRDRNLYWRAVCRRNSFKALHSLGSGARAGRHGLEGAWADRAASR